MTTKKCKECGKILPVSEFHKHPSTKLRIQSKCKLCVKAYTDSYKSTQAEKDRARKMRLPPEYNVWLAMRDRCNNPKNKYYGIYGGRGISVCKRWDTFMLFLDDMGSRPSSRYQIDRRNNDGNYDPSNCRWVLPSINVRNRSCVKLDEFKVKSIRLLYASREATRAELARLFSVSWTTVNAVVKKKIWRTI